MQEDKTEENLILCSSDREIMYVRGNNKRATTPRPVVLTREEDTDVVRRQQRDHVVGVVVAPIVRRAVRTIKDRPAVRSRIRTAYLNRTPRRIYPQDAVLGGPSDAKLGPSDVAIQLNRGNGP